MTTYRERREARAGRLEEWAGKRDAKAQDLHKANEPYRGDHALMTQPGHIPERARMNRRDDKAYEHSTKAASMRGRAESIKDQLDKSIYSDDPDAVEQLQERIATLEAQRDRIKAYNASCRAGKPDEALLDEAQRRDLESCRRHAPYQVKNNMMPGYALTNLSGNINRQKKRLVELRGDAVPEQPKYPCVHCGSPDNRWFRRRYECWACGKTFTEAEALAVQARLTEPSESVQSESPPNQGTEQNGATEMTKKAKDVTGDIGFKLKEGQKWDHRWPREAQFQPAKGICAACEQKRWVWVPWEDQEGGAKCNPCITTQREKNGWTPAGTPAPERKVAKARASAKAAGTTTMADSLAAEVTAAAPAKKAKKDPYATTITDPDGTKRRMTLKLDPTTGATVLVPAPPKPKSSKRKAAEKANIDPELSTALATVASQSDAEAAAKAARETALAEAKIKADIELAKSANEAAFSKVALKVLAGGDPRAAAEELTSRRVPGTRDTGDGPQELKNMFRIH